MTFPIKSLSAKICRLRHVTESLVLESVFIDGLLSMLFFNALRSALLSKQCEILLLLCVSRVLLAFTNGLKVAVVIAVVE